MNSGKKMLESDIGRFIRPIETVLSSEFTIEQALGKLREKPLKEKIQQQPKMWKCVLVDGM